MIRSAHSFIAVTVASMMLATIQAAAEETADGDVGLVLRYRFETVDQDSFQSDAQASTLLARLNYRTSEASGWSGFIEFDTVFEVGSDDYNSGAGTSGPDRARFPVVADPDDTEINQAYVQYQGASDVQIRLGRQRINFDNQRFVGGVAWRQNEQTFDAVSIRGKPWKHTELTYAYIDNVNRIFGTDVAAGDNASSTHFLHAKSDLKTHGALSTYAYLLDNADVPGFSTDTLGARWTNEVQAADKPLRYTLEAAYQRDAANNPTDFNAHYVRVDGDWAFKPLALIAGIEVLSGDTRPGSAFRTPLATLHAFNGWADLFLSTPDSGLEDLFVGARGTAGRFKWRALYHDFSAESGSGDFGNEVNLLTTTSIGKHASLLLKFADFRADSPSYPDTRKAWIMVTASF